MNDHLAAIRSVVTELETIQEDIGKSQVELLQVLTDETQDEWDCPSQIGLLKLENVQRTIGEIQTLLVEAMPVCEHSPAVEHQVATFATATPIDGTATAVAVASAATPVPTPQHLLEARGIKVTKVVAPSGLDATADRAALLLGEKFSLLNSFYQIIKRRVTGDQRLRWFRTSDLSREALIAVCDFGTRMKDGGFFSEFRFFSKGTHHDPQPVILFDPTADHRIRAFFEGGWLERHVLQVLKREAQQATGLWCDEQFAKGIHVEYPDGTKGEIDSLVSMPPDRLLWLECKSGKWQNYIKHFQSINRKFLRIPKEQSALVLVQQLDEAEKASASELTGMTVIHFSELREWLKTAIA